MILILDNYDSFVFNLARYFEELDQQVTVYRNDALSLDGIARLDPTALVLSPGPCAPQQAGICLEAIRHFSGKLPILGICLGHQAIGEAFGGVVSRAIEPMHGRASHLKHRSTGLFNQIPSPLAVARYHSLIVENETLPDCLEVTVKSNKGEIMVLRHKDHPTFGLQFHPESILTQHGHNLLKNFLEEAHVWRSGNQS
ncbi:anthranilate synthase component II [Cohaesibacter gelatinilyticus]|uniref:Anthranilate synthase, component II n=1 Tax=Cohaesibacter gelatinilyticus TaxID=372072 RepID=A0A285NKE9_9HYPH|nr:aminodeoxychorismate/anthranilate synthase component II [Cohaesibacter gelatinilyticus]SNZ08121.1 anthranilate synthase, component II [Cohaesibacter gelatinilyticus]